MVIPDMFQGQLYLMSDTMKLKYKKLKETDLNASRLLIGFPYWDRYSLNIQIDFGGIKPVLFKAYRGYGVWKTTSNGKGAYKAYSFEQNPDIMYSTIQPAADVVGILLNL
jgi:hypothetical protein